MRHREMEGSPIFAHHSELLGARGWWVYMRPTSDPIP